MAQSDAAYTVLAAEEVSSERSEKTVNIVQGTAVPTSAAVAVAVVQPNVQVVHPNGAPHVNVYAQGQGPLISDAGYYLPPGPMGKWADGLCACCSDCGACMMVFCVPCIPFAQLYERMVKAGTFTTVLIITAVAFVLQRVIYQAAAAMRTAETISAFYSMVSMVNIAVACVVLFVLMQVRANVRRHYNIPEECCHGCEDCCCAWWCWPCATCQIMRHINDYSGTRTQGCQCTETGMDTGFNPQVWYGNAVGTSLHTSGQNPNAAFLV